MGVCEVAVSDYWSRSSVGRESTEAERRFRYPCCILSVPLVIGIEQRITICTPNCAVPPFFWPECITSSTVVDPILATKASV